MRHRGLKLPATNRKSQIRQRGYMLITMMLGIALMTVALLAVLPAIRQQIQRDQEEEMRHRGTGYMRAIQRYYKRMGRYPTRLEDLENTNNVRFLRKRYTDPLVRDPQTGKQKDFKILHMQDVNLNSGPVLGGAGGLGSLAGQAGALGQLGQGGASALNALAGGAGGLGNLQGALGQVQQQLGGLQGGGGTPTLTQSGAADESEPGNPAGSATSGSQDSGTTSASGSASGGASGTSGGSSLNAISGSTGQLSGGGPILGVMSTSKLKTIREFNHKTHYNDWLFIYDPTSDRGGLLVGPWQVPQATTLPGATPAGQMGQGITGQSGQGGLGGGFGQGISQPNSNSPFQNNQQQPQQNPQQNSPDQ